MAASGITARPVVDWKTDGCLFDAVPDLTLYLIVLKSERLRSYSLTFRIVVDMSEGSGSIMSNLVTAMGCKVILLRDRSLDDQMACFGHSGRTYEQLQRHGARRACLSRSAVTTCIVLVTSSKYIDTLSLPLYSALLAELA